MTKLSELIDKTQSHLVTIKGSSGKIWFELSLFWALLIAIAARKRYYWQRCSTW